MTEITPDPQPIAPTRAFFGRVVLKGLLLFALCNLIFAVVYPMKMLGSVSLYNRVLPGRSRLPYGENPALAYNVSLNNLPALFAAHEIQQPKAADEFRVLLIGDSNVWGWLLDETQTLAAFLNDAEITVGERRVVAYNLGYPVLSATKDLLLLDEAMRYQPDLIVWPVTLRSLAPEQQLFPPLIQHNPERLKTLITTYPLHLNADDERLVQPDFWQRTIIGQRRPLADWLRLQTYGFAWAATGVDQHIPQEIELRQSDFEADASWEGYTEATELTRNALAFDVLAAGISRAGDVPVLLINEPIFISQGQNSDIRYNSFYPRWAYDQYRQLLAEAAAENHWHYVDWWDTIAPEEFTDSPVHLTPQGTQQFSQRIQEWIEQGDLHE